MVVTIKRHGPQEFEFRPKMDRKWPSRRIELVHFETIFRIFLADFRLLWLGPAERLRSGFEFLRSTVSLLTGGMKIMFSQKNRSVISISLRSNVLTKVLRSSFGTSKLSFAAWVMKWAAPWQQQQNGVCAQRRLRSAWASAQSDQSLCCSHEESLGP